MDGWRKGGGSAGFFSVPNKIVVMHSHTYLIDGTFCELEVSDSHSVVGLLAGTVGHPQIEGGELTRELLLKTGEVHPLSTIHLHGVCSTVCV